MAQDLNRYYRVLFPLMVELGLLRLVTCDGRWPLERVELAPRYIAAANGFDAMQRHLRFHSAADLVAHCQRERPATLQLGGVLPAPPQEAFEPLPMTGEPETEKEAQRRPMDAARQLMRSGASALGPLVFDIDANDYPERNAIRGCSCEAAERTVCQACWETLMEPARHVIRYWLEDVFGLQQRFDTFSGRRGLHSWCYDARVLLWTREQRTAFMERITLASLAVSSSVTTHAAAIDDILRATVPATKVPDIATLERAELFRRFYPRFDVAVTTDGGHLKGLPLSMHQATRILRIPIAPLAPHGAPRTHALDLKRHCKGPSEMFTEDVTALVKGVLGLAFPAAATAAAAAAAATEPATKKAKTVAVDDGDE